MTDRRAKQLEELAFLRRNRKWDHFFVFIFRVMTYSILLMAGLIFFHVVFKGASAFITEEGQVDLSFLLEIPENRYVFSHEGEQQVLSETQLQSFLAASGRNLQEIDPEIYTYADGGILPAIAGSVFLMILTMILTVFLGVSAAVYLSEYAKDSRLLQLIRLAILNLSGVPSIIYGLFGLGIFVLLLDWGESLLAGSCTLALLSLPLMITASEEALKGVPDSLREASFGLGATRWQTLWRTVLPGAFPGMVTASILAMVRVAGETAPIFFTAAFAFRDLLPWQVGSLGEFFFQGVMALPFHLYVLTTRLPANAHTQDAQYGTALVFVLLVGMLAIFAHFLRSRYRQENPFIIE